MFRQAVDEEDQRSHHDDETNHQPGEPRDASIECGRNVSPGYFVGELTEKCSSAGADDQAGGITTDDVCSHEANIGQVECSIAVDVTIARIFLGRHRFAGQGGLVDEKILGFK